MFPGGEWFEDSVGKALDQEFQSVERHGLRTAGHVEPRTISWVQMQTESLTKVRSAVGKSA